MSIWLFNGSSIYFYNKQNFHSPYSLTNHIKVNYFLYCHSLKILYRDLDPRRYRSQSIFSFYLVLCCTHYVLSWKDLNPRRSRSQNIFDACCSRVMNALLGCNHVVNTLLGCSRAMNVLLDCSRIMNVLLNWCVM